MHISDGIIPVKWAIIGNISIIPILYLAGKKINPEDVPKMGIFSAALFVISLIHFPLGASSIHLCLFGLAGILFKRHSIPIIFTTLLFQSLIFQHGGLLTIGINTLIMSCGALTANLIWKASVISEKIRAILAGFLGILVPSFLITLLFWFLNYGKGMFFLLSLYFPAALVEAGLTFFIIFYLKKTNSGVLK